MLRLLSSKPTASDVAERLLVLRYVAIHALTTPPPDLLARWLRYWSEEERRRAIQGFEKIRRQLCATLRQAGLWETLSRKEQGFMLTPALELTPQQVIDGSWRLESAICLMWALRLLPEIPPYDRQAMSDILGRIPYKRPWVFVRSAQLRPQAEIERARDLAEMWHWRSRARQLEDEGFEPPVGSGVASLQEIVSLTAHKMANAGMITAAREGDFPAFGKPYRALEEKEWLEVRSIAIERHQALNWLSGLAPGNRWDETPTAT